MKRIQYGNGGKFGRYSIYLSNMEDLKVINGRQIAKKGQEALKTRRIDLNVTPKIVSILVGDDPSSVLYSNIKQKKAEELGVSFELKKLPEDINFEDLVSMIKNLNKDSSIHGIMVQLPLPKGILEDNTLSTLLNTINPEKDVDGLRTNSQFLPAAAKAVMTIIEVEGINLLGKKVVVVGASDLVGKPIAREIEKQGGKVTICDSKTPDLRAETVVADILITACGAPKLITGDIVKSGVIIIDVGAKKVDGKITGDVDFESVYPKASKITPVPGGVGPVTVICLMENAVKASLSFKGLSMGGVKNVAGSGKQ